MNLSNPDLFLTEDGKNSETSHIENTAKDDTQLDSLDLPPTALTLKDREMML